MSGYRLRNVLCLGLVLATAIGNAGIVPARQSDAPRTQQDARVNIALGCHYTLSPPPDYALCTDEGDKVQLTDGITTSGHFWTQKSTVGWNGGKPIQIILDLGKPQPIGGVSYSTAAGTAGVEWPLAIHLWVSDDERDWWEAGELVGLSAVNGLPPNGGYALHRFQTDRLHTHGRYLALQITSNGYTFCDEIEVYRGPEMLLRLPRSGTSVTDLKRAYHEREISAAINRQIRADVVAVRRQLDTVRLLEQERNRLQRRLAEAETAALLYRQTPEQPAILPYCEAHARVFAVRAAVWRARGLRQSVWQTGRWDPLQPGDTPPDRKRPSIDLLMLRNETRGAVLNITNPTETAGKIAIRFQGLPGGPLPGWITVRKAVWTGTAAGPPVASALPEARCDNTAWWVDTVPGMTQQVWFSVDSAALRPGQYHGKAVLSVDKRTLAAVPFTVQVVKHRMPDRLALSLGGWDYTDTPTYGITSHNLASTLAFLKQYHVDAPWAHATVMPFGRHDSDGRMLTPPNTGPMDRWLARWKGARFYFVFNRFSEPLPDTPAAQRKVREWIGFWTQHLARKGISPSQLGLLLVDEPRTSEMDRIINSYAPIIRAAAPQVQIFEDPTWDDPHRADPGMYANSTFLCPNRVMWIGARKAYEEVFLALQKTGRALAFYSCSGPVRALDPYTYNRLQAWDCFRYGSIHMGFWAFGDTGGASSWNEFAATGAGFAPEFLGTEGCITSKSMEAIREGLYDHQTLTLLQKQVKAAERSGRSDEAIRHARTLLEEGPKQVTEAQGAKNIQWAAPKDRSLADRVRHEVIAALEALSP